MSSIYHANERHISSACCLKEFFKSHSNVLRNIINLITMERRHILAICSFQIILRVSPTGFNAQFTMDTKDIHYAVSVLK